MLSVVTDEQTRVELTTDLDKLVREGARRMLAAALEAEAEASSAAHQQAERLRDLRRRGVGAPVLVVGDGALRLWRALREVFPATREQRCRVHKAANVVNALPKSVQAGARRALNEITMAADRAHAGRAIQAFAADDGAKWPRAVAKVVNGPHRGALGRAGAGFRRGLLVERPAAPAREVAA